MLAIFHSTGEEKARTRAMDVLPFLIESGKDTAAWGSGSRPDAMSATNPYSNVQGIVISALVRLCDGRPTGETADVIDRAIMRMILPVQYGGTVSLLGNRPFLEEAPRTPIKHILNGCIWGLLGLFDAADGLGHPEAKKVSLLVEESLGSHISKFMVPGGWSLYGFAYGHRYLASARYHASHIDLIRVLAERTQDKRFFDALSFWEKAQYSPLVRVIAAAAKSAQVVWLRDVNRLRLDLCP